MGLFGTIGIYVSGIKERVGIMLDTSHSSGQELLKAQNDPSVSGSIVVVNPHTHTEFPPIK